jgi:branched-chain amino acid transport system substrate-binding protein
MQQRKKLFSVQVLVVLIFSFFLTACGSASTTANKDASSPNTSTPVSAAPNNTSKGSDTGDIVIGTLWPLSGGSASWGNDNLNGAKIAVEVINTAGGVNGKKVALKNADNASSPQTAASEAERLVQDGVKVIVGTVISSGALPASQVAEKNNVIYWEADAVTDDLTNRSFKNLFRVNEKAGDHAVGAVEFTRDVVAKKLNTDLKSLKIAVAYEDSAYGTSVANAALQSLEKNGVKPVLKESFSAKATDLSSLVLKIKKAAPDVLLHVGYTPDQVLFWKQAQQYELDLKALVGMAGWTLQPTGDGLGKSANGIFDASGPVGINIDGLDPATKKLHEDFVKRYQELYKAPPSLSSFQGFTAMYLLLKDVLPKAGSLEPDKIREAAMALDIPVGGTIIGWGVKFDPATHHNTRAFASIMQWQDQKIKVVYPQKFASGEPQMIPLPKWSERK